MKESNAKISGILSIISGSMGLMNFVGCMLVVLMFSFIQAPAFGFPDFPGGNNFLEVFTIIYTIIGIASLILGIFSIVGGVFALQRRYWGVALAAAIASIICFSPTGIPAVIFASTGQHDFKGREEAIPASPVQG